MRRRPAVRATIVLAIAALASASSAAVSLPASLAAPVAVTPGGPRVVVVDCEYHPQTRPAGFLQACADGSLRLTGLRWTTWDADAAVGTGQQVVNDCEPYCAVGHYHTYPVRVRLDEPRTWAGRAGTTHYTRLSVTYTGAKPKLWRSLWRQHLWS